MKALNIFKLLQGVEGLSPTHRQDVETSGIPPDVATGAGFRSVPPNVIPKILGACNYGWAAERVEGLMAIPYSPLNGDLQIDFYRFKVTPAIETEKGTTKYLQLEGSENSVYCPPGVDPKGKDPLYVEEGEKKALKLTKEGFPCLSVPGVWGWKKDGHAIPDFNLINWKKRDVVIVFDADVAVNEHVQEAETALAEELTRRKAKVFILRLPYGPGCAKGADDYIVKHGVEAFKRIKPKPFKSQGRRKRAPAPDGEKIYLCGYGYFKEHGRLCLEGFGRKGEPESTPLADFTAQIREEITRDDGLKRQIEFHITGTRDTGQPLPPVVVPAKDYNSLNWARTAWGAAASVAPGRNLAPHLVNAILAHSPDIKRRTVYAQTGFHQINGVWRYLHGAGAFGQGDPVKVDLGANLKAYRLPEPGGVEAARASLRFLDVGPWEVMAPLLSFVYLAPLADLLKIDFSLWLHGRTGKLKSTLAALALAHYGDFRRDNLPGSWFSTVNSLEKLLFTLKDALCVIDDFNPPSSQKESHAMSEKAGRIIYQIGNRSSRGRLAPDLTDRPNYYPRSLLISTGEMLLPGQRQSATARYLGIDFKGVEIDMGRLTEAQEDQGLYPQALAAYTDYLLPQLDDTVLMIRDLWKSYRTAFQKGGHLRIPEIQAWLAVGFEMMLRFMTHIGAISESQAYELNKRAWQVFEGLGAKHSQIIEGERATLKFMTILKELFYQGKVYVESTAGAGCPPPCPHPELRWPTTGEPARNAVLVGYADESTLYLLPDAVIASVKGALRQSGDYLSLGKIELLGALETDGLIEAWGNENTRQKWIQGGNKRVIFLPLLKIFPVLEGDGK